MGRWTMIDMASRAAQCFGTFGPFWGPFFRPVLRWRHASGCRLVLQTNRPELPICCMIRPACACCSPAFPCLPPRPPPRRPQVRQLASAAALDGTVDAAAAKWVRHQKTTLLELQRRAAEKAQQVFEKQASARSWGLPSSCCRAPSVVMPGVVCAAMLFSSAIPSPQQWR